MTTTPATNRIAGVMIGLVLVIFSVSTYWAISDSPDTLESTKPTEPPTGHYVPDEVRRLVSFVDSARADSATRHDHEFAATGVRYVAAALGVVASSSGLNIDPELEAIREQATAIQRDPLRRERAAHARLAFATLAALLEAVQQARFQGLEPDVANVSRAAWSLRVDRPLRDQAEVMEEFFNRASSAIGAMNDAASSLPAAPPMATA